VKATGGGDRVAELADSGTLPVPIGAGGNRALSTLDQLAEIPEEDIWLAKQKSGRRTRGLPVRC